MKLKARAKINLFLDVLKKRQDGYHEIMSLMTLVEGFYDIIHINKSKNISVKVKNFEDIKEDETNTAYRAAKVFFEKTGINSGANIIIEKYIPHGAGLGGGSSDAAAVFKGLNRLYNTNLSKNKLAEMGVLVGADVPFCIMGGTMLARGIGEILTKVKLLNKAHLLIVKPNFSISTKKAYEDIDNLKCEPSKKFLQSVLKGDFSKTYNIFEEVAPVFIKEIKNELVKNGALGAVMSGSGSAVVGFFEDRKTLLRAVNFVSRYGSVHFGKI